MARITLITVIDMYDAGATLAEIRKATRYCESKIVNTLNAAGRDGCGFSCGLASAERARLQRLARELDRNPPPPLYVPDYARTGEDLLAEARANQESEAYQAWLNEPEPPQPEAWRGY